MNLSSLYIALVFIMLPLQSSEDVKAVVQQKLDAFQAGVIKKDIESLLDMFEINGAFGQAKGRGEIRMALGGHLNNEILHFSMITEKTDITPNLVNHMGRFSQELIVNGFKKKNNGLFRIIWAKSDKGWFIQYMSMDSDRSN